MEQITRGATQREARAEAVRVGVDLAKRVIQVHAVDAAGQVLTGRALPRDKFLMWCAQLPAGCIVAMETSSSSHHWARKLIAQRSSAGARAPWNKWKGPARAKRSREGGRLCRERPLCSRARRYGSHRRRPVNAGLRNRADEGFGRSRQRAAG